MCNRPHHSLELHLSEWALSHATVQRPGYRPPTPYSLQYTGDAHNARMEGQGEYTFPDGMVYKGAFYNGMFHGKGELHFPHGGVYTSEWFEGKEVQGRYTFRDGLEYGGVRWDYATPLDRRFYTERQDKIQPSGDTALSDKPQEGAVIPEGCWDLGNDMHLAVQGTVHPDGQPAGAAAAASTATAHSASAESGTVFRTSTGEELREATAAEIAWATAKARQVVSGSSAKVARMRLVHDHFAPVPGHAPATGKVRTVFQGGMAPKPF